jgi:hypothetical protein
VGRRGATFVAVDTLVHNFLHRTGILRRFCADDRLSELSRSDFVPWPMTSVRAVQRIPTSCPPQNRFPPQPVLSGPPFLGKRARRVPRHPSDHILAEARSTATPSGPDAAGPAWRQPKRPPAVPLLLARSNTSVGRGMGPPRIYYAGCDLTTQLGDIDCACSSVRGWTAAPFR